MIAGRLRYRVELLRPSTTVNAYGEQVTTWEAVGSVRAERVRLTGSRRDEAAEMWSDYAASYNIRDAHRVEEQWRVREAGGCLMSVAAIIPNKERGYITLQCVRVNE